MPAFDYHGEYAYHVILGTRERAPIFRDIAFGEQCSALIDSAAERTSFRILAYCFMPDHVHALVLGSNESATLPTFVQRFKQLTGYAFKKKTDRRLWQQSFFDRVIRVDEDLLQVAEYIFTNPVQAGLVEAEAAYSLSGGEYFEVDEAKASSLRPAPVLVGGYNA